MIFFLIILFIENVGLINDIQNFKPINNQERISIIGNQAIDIQKKTIYRLIKRNEQPIIKHPNKIKLCDRNFNKSF